MLKIKEVIDDILDFIWGDDPKRARNGKGRYVGDDKSTPDYNEAWEGGEAPDREVDEN